MAATLYLNNARDLDLLLGYLHLAPKVIEISKKKRQGSLGNSGPGYQQGDVIVSGILNVAKQLIAFASDFSPEAKALLGFSQLENVQIHQWMEYCETHLKPSIDDFHEMQNRAEELNEHLANQTFMVGNRLSLADLLIFQNIHVYMTAQSFQGKEKYIHISRWFRNFSTILAQPTCYGKKTINFSSGNAVYDVKRSAFIEQFNGSE